MERAIDLHLFAPFRSTKKGGWASGSIRTQQAVEGQAGEIVVESMEGHGTIFTVRCPLRSDRGSSLESVL
jgi:nitrogen-specific signal transduction histidine kinase